MNHPIIVEQINLPFGIKQAGSFLELVLYEVGSQAKSSIARAIVCHFRQVDNMLYSFKNRELLEATGEEILQLMEKNQYKYSVEV